MVFVVLMIVFLALIVVFLLGLFGSVQVLDGSYSTACGLFVAAGITDVVTTLHSLDCSYLVDSSINMQNSVTC